jgi:hypothetical protein
VTDTLKNQLRTLRLSGVLQTLDARHRQALEGQWSYHDFLTRLLEDEVERRAQKQLVGAKKCWADFRTFAPFTDPGGWRRW